MKTAFSEMGNITQQQLALIHKVNNPNIIRCIDNQNSYDFEKTQSYTKDLIDEWIIYRGINTQEFEKCKVYITKILRTLDKKYKLSRKMRQATIIRHLRIFFRDEKIDLLTFYQLMELLTTKNRSTSGILEIAIMTGPGDFSCKFDCHYCPNQPGIARSYIKEEPAVRRAAQNDFDCVKQINTRISSYLSLGQPADKGEFIILGGTFSNYSDEYRTTFMRDLYYACNTYFDYVKRFRKSLAKEKEINHKHALFKVIGLTVETRPDCIDEAEIIRYIKYGVTRVQLGVQHTDDKLLKKINRQCYTSDTKRGMTLLKQAGFKILCHYMPNLPGTTPQKDKDMFNNVIYDEDLIADEWKIYPTSVPTTSSKDIEEVNTVIEKWYNDGQYVPYGDQHLEEVIRYAKIHIPGWIRISRIFRDIPVDNIVGGARTPHLRQILQKKMAEDGEFCKCIRCREIKSREIDIKRIIYRLDKYIAHGGTEYFISANYMPSLEERQTLTTLELNQLDTVGGYIVGFCRLRIQEVDDELDYLPILKGCAIVRELHVYGKMVPSYLSGILKSNTQHKGIGTKLMDIAEGIAINKNIHKLAVISGVGVRGFYENKLGYKLVDNYMIKNIYDPFSKTISRTIHNIIIYLIYSIIMYCGLYYIIKIDL